MRRAMGWIAFAGTLLLLMAVPAIMLRVESENVFDKPYPIANRGGKLNENEEYENMPLVQTLRYMYGDAIDNRMMLEEQEGDITEQSQSISRYIQQLEKANVLPHGIAEKWTQYTASLPSAQYKYASVASIGGKATEWYLYYMEESGVVNASAGITVDNETQKIISFSLWINGINLLSDQYVDEGEIMENYLAYLELDGINDWESLYQNSGNMGMVPDAASVSLLAEGSYYRTDTVGLLAYVQANVTDLSIYILSYV